MMILPLRGVAICNGAILTDLMALGTPMGTLRPTTGFDSAFGMSTVAALVRRHDRDRYQTALFAPAEKREALFALYAFNYEIARVRESVREPMLGQIRLQWWREAVDTAFAGGAPRPHEVVEPLTAAIRTYHLSRAPFDRLIDARERDLDDAPPATLAALEEYAEGTSAVLIDLALEMLDTATSATRDAARRVGIAYAFIGLLRAIPIHARTGRLWIPEDIAATAGLDRADYSALRATPALRRTVETLADSAAQHLAIARAAKHNIARAALPALLPARIADRSLRRLARAGFDPFAPELARADPLQAWRLTAAVLAGRF
jgi:NADH dehydrogenase [ubiquinone] 1 alpha subcomplex assembly factor 6